MVPVKGNFNKTSLNVRLKALKDWRTGCLTKTLQQNTVFIGTWFFRMGKSKDKSLASLENKGVSSKRKDTSDGDFKKVAKAIYTWFICKGSQQIPIAVVILKEKVSKFAKALGETKFKVSHYWLRKW